MSSSEEFASADEEVQGTEHRRKTTSATAKDRRSKGSPSRTPPEVTQCWEFESWEDYDKQEKQKQAAHDGWDDVDDDWGETVKPPTTLTLESAQVTEKREQEDVTKVLERLSMGAEEKKQGSWGAWKPWSGITALLNTATESVATLTSHVSEGLSTAIESGIGVPDPVAMARHDLQEEKRIRDSSVPESEASSGASNSGLGSFVSGVSQISSKVINGGLDTLEGIGKKTMNMLQENDPRLMNKRKLLGLEGDNKSALSQMLREAKEKSEEKERNMKQLQKNSYKKQLHFETLFDDYCGLVHLEALEMLSKQSSLKMESLMAPLSGKALKELLETIAEVQELCELPELDDESDEDHSAEQLEKRLSAAFEDVDKNVELEDLVDVWRKSLHFLSTDNPRSAQELYDRALHTLAETTALAVNRMHKLAELMLVQEHHSTVNEADSLVQLTTALCWHLGGIAERFGNVLSDKKLFVITDEEDPDALITSIFLEGANSTSYIKNAFQLFVPILQLGAA